MERVGSLNNLLSLIPQSAIDPTFSPGLSPSGLPWPVDTFELAQGPGRWLAGFPNPILQGDLQGGLQLTSRAGSFGGNGFLGFDANGIRQTIAGGANTNASLAQPLMYGGRELLPAGTQLSNFFAGYLDHGPAGLSVGLRNLLGIDNRDLANGSLDTALDARVTNGTRPGAFDVDAGGGLRFGGTPRHDLDLGQLIPGLPIAVRGGARTEGGLAGSFSVRDLSANGARDFAARGAAGLSTSLVTTDDIRLGPDGPVLIPRGTQIDPQIAARFNATPDHLSAFLRDRVGLDTSAVDTPIGRASGFRGELGGDQSIELTRDQLRAGGKLQIDGVLKDPLRLGPIELAPGGARLLGNLSGNINVNLPDGSGSAKIAGAELFAGKRLDAKHAWGERGTRIKGHGDLAWDANQQLTRANGDVEAFSGVRGGLRANRGRGPFVEGEAGVRVNAGADYDGGKLRRAEGDAYLTAGARAGWETKHGRTSLGVSGRAGASLGFSAKADKGDVDLGAKAFLGAGAGVELRHDVKAGGKDVGHASVKAEALAGIGVDAKFQTSNKDGKLSWNFELGAALGVGFKIGFSGSLDLPKHHEAAKRAGELVDRTTA